MIKTYFPKAQDLKKKWFVIDAEGKTLGRLAPVIANALRGKDKVIFSPSVDCGDHVIVINVDKIKLTGNKMTDKIYYTHSGFLGGLKEESADKLITRKPGKLLELAVYGMLPKNRLRRVFMGKLKLYAGSEHGHASQQPEKLEV